MSRNGTPERLVSQLIGSATSVAANYRVPAVQGQKAEFIAELRSAADETMFWLESLETGISNESNYQNPLRRSKQLLYILSSSEKTSKGNLKKKFVFQITKSPN